MRGVAAGAGGAGRPLVGSRLPYLRPPTKLSEWTVLRLLSNSRSSFAPSTQPLRGLAEIPVCEDDGLASPDGMPKVQEVTIQESRKNIRNWQKCKDKSPAQCAFRLFLSTQNMFALCETCSTVE
ncbi:unnamed protein product [Caenorhabditis auriculariae]|uniref:Uncharacterized protein n=1 Tax=Caenorhabditis auriculariae TaxID=2777116 RepID=A0A8S1HE11_9PELO|nr:unnamed protein product [Caenorhabditis auriculariae]